MTDLGFGQPIGGIMQMAYIVEDIDEAIGRWVRDLRVGPWFLLDHWAGNDPVYRGQPSGACVKIAMAFAGHMQIELIQPKDEAPSVYRETQLTRGFGFHHFGIASADVESDIKAYQARGFELAFKAGVPTGGNVAYMDGGPAHGGFIELIPATAGMNEAFTGFWRASLNWDGAQPVRPFA